MSDQTPFSMALLVAASTHTAMDREAGGVLCFGGVTYLVGGHSLPKSYIHERGSEMRRRIRRTAEVAAALHRLVRSGDFHARRGECVEVPYDKSAPIFQ